MLRIVGKELSYDWYGEPFNVQFGAVCGVPLNDF